MPGLKIDAVSVTSGDLARSAAFYRLLGFNFPDFAPDAKHLEPVTAEGEVRLMIDDKDLIESILGVAPKRPITPPSP